MGLRRILETSPPSQVWLAARDGEPANDHMERYPAVIRMRWQRQALGLDLARLYACCVESATAVSYLGSSDFPKRLAGDRKGPAVLFSQGELGLLDSPRCIAVIGTREATGYGRDVAWQLGRDLSEAGVNVISGLARGIDGAVHSGALADLGQPGSPIGVVAGGIDMVYPRRHAELFQQVKANGVLVTEAYFRAPASPLRFKLRNRIIAGLSDAVVIVESRSKGGSMITVAAAMERKVPVYVVPGPVGSIASSGTNELLVRGHHAIRDAADVLEALGEGRGLLGEDLSGMETGVPRSSSLVRGVGSGASLPASSKQSVDFESGGLEAAVLAAVDCTPTLTATIVLRTGLDIGEAVLNLTRLEKAGMVRRGGGWWERI